MIDVVEPFNLLSLLTVECLLTPTTWSPYKSFASSDYEECEISVPNVENQNVQAGAFKSEI